ncbi:MAG: glycosyltransferase [Acidobacteriota bacterium]
MIVLSSIILAMWVLTLVRTVANLAAIPRLRTRAPRSFPLVSVIIPARDEERTIGRTVRAMLAQTYPELEILVVNDRSVDATGAILQGLGDPRLIVIDGVEPLPGWLGKPWALQQASMRARGELLLFVDADVIYQPEAVGAAVAHLQERDVSLLSLFPHMEMHGFWEHVVMPNLAVFAFSFLPLWAANRSRFPLLAIGGGPGNLVRRLDYQAAGGHEALKDAVVDDVGLARLMRRNRYRTEVVRAEAGVSVRMYHGLAEIVQGFTKNAFAVFGYNYVMAALFLLLALVFHLLPFVLAVTGDRLALAALVLIAITRLILFRSMRYRLDNALFAHPLMIVTWCWILVRSVWITGIRRRLLWRGRVYDARGTKF